MARRRRTPVGGEGGEAPSQKEVPAGDQSERIRQLEEEIRRLEEENRRIGEDIRRIEKENEIFRKILESKGIDTDGALAGTVSMDEDGILDELRELRRKVNMNSGNSSMPPSSDRPWRKPDKRGQRGGTGKKSGGQIGHHGSTISKPEKVDRIVPLYPAGCEGCPMREKCESEGTLACAETRTTVDLKIVRFVTEYRALERGPCPFAGAGGDIGVFPEDVRAFTQYGDGVAVLTGILDSYGAMSDKRIAEVVNGISGLKMASSTVVSMVRRCAEKVAPAMEPIADAVAAGPVTNCDETGARAVVEVEKKDGSGTESVSRNMWVHGASNPSFTYLHASLNRGYDGMVEAGVLPRVKGTIVHDCWSPYWRFERLMHGLCNAHILRELKGVIENRPEHGWAKRFIDLLIGMKEAKEEALASGASSLSAEVLDGFHRRYTEILDAADEECPPPPPSGKGRGRRKGKERSLIERLREREDEICLFVRDLSAPFDNNLAERAFRFVKTKTKVSGCFRSPGCLQQYLDIMSYIDTARKHGISAFKAMEMAFQGRWAEAIGLSEARPSTAEPPVDPTP